jgi:hypothetical protein
MKCNSSRDLSTGITTRLWGRPYAMSAFGDLRSSRTLLGYRFNPKSSHSLIVAGASVTIDVPDASQLAGKIRRRSRGNFLMCK